MTREEAIKYWKEFLNEIPDLLKKGFSKEEAKKQEEACKLAIKALEERPKGRWIERSYQHHYYTDIIFTTYECPFCGKVQSLKEPYCTCGADMRESEQE